MIQDIYVQGFMDKCASMGVDAEALIKWATMESEPPAPAAELSPADAPVKMAPPPAPPVEPPIPGPIDPRFLHKAPAPAPEPVKEAPPPAEPVPPAAPATPSISSYMADLKASRLPPVRNNPSARGNYAGATAREAVPPALPAAPAAPVAEPSPEQSGLDKYYSNRNRPYTKRQVVN